MKRILVLGTGGTIASMPSDEGLVPQLSSRQMFEKISGIESICQTDFIEVFNLDSTNITPDHWLLLEKTIEEHYAEYDGFVITHGTDTMAYSAAALSYLIQNSSKPIVFTGAQVPFASSNSDAGRNMTDALLYACDSDSHGVQIVFSGSVILGTRARKNFTKKFDAFTSINYPEIARIHDGKVFRYICEEPDAEVRFFRNLDKNIGLVKLVPGFDSKVMKFALDYYDAVIVESFGVGGLPEYSHIFDEIKKATRKGKLVVFTTQVPNEGSDISIYKVGRFLKNTEGILEAYDMTLESVFAKLMWLLGNGFDRTDIPELFYRPVSHDILR